MAMPLLFDNDASDEDDKWQWNW